MAEKDDFKLSDHERSIAQKFARLEAEEEFCKLLWKRLHRHKRNFARAAGLGRKKQVCVRISETHQVKIVNQYQGVDEVFAGGFARKFDISKIKLPA